MTSEEAIKILKELVPQPQRGDGKSTTHLYVTEALIMAINVLEHAPKQGHWIELNDGRYKCSACGIANFDWEDYNYCPSCGAEMEESEE